MLPTSARQVGPILFKALKQNALAIEGRGAWRTCTSVVDTRKYRTPVNTIIMFVPQQEAWVVERMGKFHKTLEPGLNFLIPILDKVQYVQSLKELAIEVPKQSAITADNVTLSIDGVLYVRVTDPYLASYGVEDPEFAVLQLAQTTMRSELGRMRLDSVFREREELNTSIVTSINKASIAWGIACLRYEIRDIKLPNRIHEAMQMQVEAERKKRAAILESEGIREAEVNVAEGKRTARILSSEAIKQEEINKAAGEAAAIVAVAEARAQGLFVVSSMLRNSKAKEAAALVVAEQYVKAFGELAKTNNTMILPSNMADVSSFIGQALSMYKHLTPEVLGRSPPEESKELAPGESDFQVAYNKMTESIEAREVAAHSEERTTKAKRKGKTAAGDDLELMKAKADEASTEHKSPESYGFLK